MQSITDVFEGLCWRENGDGTVWNGVWGQVCGLNERHHYRVRWGGCQYSDSECESESYQSEQYEESGDVSQHSAQ